MCANPEYLWTGAVRRFTMTVITASVKEHGSESKEPYSAEAHGQQQENPGNGSSA